VGSEWTAMTSSGEGGIFLRASALAERALAAAFDPMTAISTRRSAVILSALTLPPILPFFAIISEKIRTGLRDSLSCLAIQALYTLAAKVMGRKKTPELYRSISPCEPCRFKRMTSA
jgi:hypothetical protein